MTLIKLSSMTFGAVIFLASMACVAAESHVCSSQLLAQDGVLLSVGVANLAVRTNERVSTHGVSRQVMSEVPSNPRRIAIAIGTFENKSTMPDSAFESLRARMQQCVAGTMKFHVQDREHLKALLREQALAAAGIVDGNNAEAPEGGKFEHASYIIYGTVQSFITDNSSYNGRGYSIAMSKSKIELLVKLVDTRTGRILAIKTACGHGVDKVIATADHTSSKNQGMSEAFDEVCHAVADWLRDNLACPPKVLKVGKGEIIVDLNENEVREGDVFDVIDAKEIIDADTDASMGLGGCAVGRVCIESTGSHVSNAKPIEDKKGNVLDPGSLDTAGHTYILRRVNKADVMDEMRKRARKNSTKFRDKHTDVK